MPEEEKIRRSLYKSKRKKLIMILSFAIAILLLCTTIFGFVFYKLNTTFYVKYTEKSDMSYSVKLKPNDFYEEEVLEEGMTYVVELIDTIQTELNYALSIKKPSIEYSYNYIIDAVTIIKEKNTKSVVLSKEENLYKSDVKTVSSDKTLQINHTINVDFNKYNDEVTNFVNQLMLKEQVECELLINAQINIVGNCQEFVQEKAESHDLSIKVPLATNLSEIQITSSIPAYQQKNLACKSDASERNVILVLFIIFGSVSALIVIALIIVIYLTRNDDINYEIKVKRIVSNYKSYIQKLLSKFDFTGYKVLKLESFNDLIEIRDTIQQPILMYENEHKTSTKFIVPADSGLVYLFELFIEKYAHYDETLNEEIQEETTSKIKKEEKTVLNETENSDAEENTPVGDPSPLVIPDIPEDDDEETSNGRPNGINYSFEAKLTLSTDEIKNRYKEIVEFAKSYGVKVSNTWKKVRIFSKSITYATLIFKGKKLCINYSLDPKAPENEKYRFIDLSEYKKYADTPSMLKITSDRKKNTAIQILTNMFTRDKLKNKNLGVIIEMPENKTKEQLLAEGLIKL